MGSIGSDRVRPALRRREVQVRDPQVVVGANQQRRKSPEQEHEVGLSWDAAVAHALSLPDTELGTTYGKPAVKIVSNGRAFLLFGREPQMAFGLALDLDTIEMLNATDPDTFWQTPHYEGWPVVLIRYQTEDEERVLALIERSREWVATKPSIKKRTRT